MTRLLQYLPWNLCLLLLLHISTASIPGPAVQDSYHIPSYKFGYGVQDHQTGDVKSAQEERHGGLTKGSYSLLQPDGVVRTVTYTADSKHGFKATVHHDKGHGKEAVLVSPVPPPPPPPPPPAPPAPVQHATEGWSSTPIIPVVHHHPQPHPGWSAPPVPAHAPKGLGWTHAKKPLHKKNLPHMDTVIFLKD